MTQPNPGSADALDQGCTCPVSDNQHGKGYAGSGGGDGIFVMALDCPLHGHRRAQCSSCRKDMVLSFEPPRGESLTILCGDCLEKGGFTPKTGQTTRVQADA